MDCQAEEVMGGSRSEEMLVLEKRERSDPESYRVMQVFLRRLSELKMRPVVDKVSGVLGNPAG